MKKILFPTVLFAGLALWAGSGQAAECGSVSIAEMNWASAGVAAQLDKFILENGYGCTATVVTGDTMPTFTSMTEKGQPDIAPEFWVNAVRAPLDVAIKEGRIVQAAPLLTDGGVDGWWVPKYITDEHPDIKSISDALNHPELFPNPEDSSKAAVMNCPAGWACQNITGNLFRAFGAEKKGFQLVDSGSAAGLDGSIANAFENHKGWIGYYWAPTAILGKYEMTRLDFGVDFDQAEWDRCTSVADCTDPKMNAFPKSPVFTLVTKRFVETAGVALDYVKTRQWDNKTVGQVLAWMNDNQATNEDAAKYFLKTYPAIWEKWVAADVAEKVKAAL